MALSADKFPYDKDSKERIPYEHYLQAFREADPEEIQTRTGIPFDGETKCFTLHFLNTQYRVSHPDFVITHSADDLPVHALEDFGNAKTLIARYLAEGSAAAGQGKYLTYREMPWGEVYIKQFQGRCLSRLAYGFGNKLQAFSGAMERLKAKKLDMGDVSYELPFLENLVLRLILWEGDDEFPPSSQILFSDNFAVAFQAEDRAVAGDILISALKALS